MNRQTPLPILVGAMLLAGCTFINDWGQFRNAAGDSGTLDASTLDAANRDAGSPTDAGPDARVADAGESDGGSRDGGTVDAGTVDAGFDAGPALCTLSTMYIPPTVAIMADGTGSMDSGWPGGLRRYSDMINALNVVLPDYEAQIAFGVLIHQVVVGCIDPPNELPALNNTAAIVSLLASYSPVGSSGGESAVRAVRTGFSLPATTGSLLMFMDSDPNADCVGGGGPSGFYSELSNLFSMDNNPCSMIAMPPQLTPSFTSTVASICGPGSLDQPFSIADLETALRQQIERAPCRFRLDRGVTATRACEASVQASTGADLTCTTDWDMPDDTTLEVRGTACIDILRGLEGDPTVVFPCDALL